ncbi:flagellar biosynthetic protein FliO [Sphingomonas sp. ABOLD]|uniref:Flagellar protein n=1 Tax=Sphingomonas trueperi TaxID=53317 RepID=A0A7X5Y1Q6_9SPHN|nr:MULTISPECIES: flagellar biosynthetic protein FliO [Sphingomonas]NJB99461.1 flagellar protein FliO/FliZ [Sphingomonas trueperi]RSV35781.1 flagellar biosynthetic protein FliO [Sphingomonas sp. ABOLD]
MGIGAVFSSILATVVALALVLGMAWGVIWLLKKLRDRQLGVAANGESDAPIRFLRSMQLGQRERVVLIEARGETMLVGVTAGSVTLLARWPEGQAPAKPVAAPVRF